MRRPTAIILAAGKGTRILPLTKQIPKCLIEINNIPIIGHQISALEKHGLKDIVIVVGYKKEQVKQYITSEFPQLKITYVENPEFEKTNTLYSLALTIGKTKSKSVLLLNGDVIFDLRIIGGILRSDYKKSYAACQFKKCGEEEIKISLNTDLTIKNMNKKIPINLAEAEAVGINKFSPLFWANLRKNLKSMKENHSKDYFELAIEKSIDDGELLIPFDIKDLKAIEIDFPKDLTLAKSLFSFKL